MDLKKVSEFEWEIPIEDVSIGVPHKGAMNVPGKIFASEEFIEKIGGDKSLDQVKNVARLPGILKGSFAMPDIHQGYGFPIGGVAAFDVETGVISPGGVGYDINCSVRLLKTNLVESDLKGREKEILHSLFRSVPSGVGRGGDLKLNDSELDEVLVGGAQWVIEKGYGLKDDFLHIEDHGKLNGANPDDVSGRAKGRGRGQLGSLGAGNHFLDVLIVDELFDEKIAKVFGLEKGQVVILIHCGSRGLGHQVASDYIRLMSDGGSQSLTAGGSDSLNLDGSKTRSLGGSASLGAWQRSVGLACAPIKSELGQKYLSAMKCAANFAFANKQIITHFVREDLKNYFPNFKAEVVYDICHNIAKIEKHGGEDVLVMRKGATRSFGPGREEVPEDYREVGQPVLVPGSMGTASYVLVGTSEAEEKSFGSCAHGAGRAMSRTEAKKKMSFEDAKKDMEERGVFVEFGGQKGMVEESPFSYKDVDEVVEICDKAGLGKKVARLRPLLVMIG